MRSARSVLLLLGLALCLGLVHQIGWEPIAESFERLSWRLPLLIVLPFSVAASIETFGWRCAFRADAPPFRRLFVARLAGDAFNLTTPTASIGGDAVTVWMLRPFAPVTASIPSIVVAKTAGVAAQVLFLLLGALLATSVLAVDSPMLRAVRWAILLEGLAVGGFVAVQVRGALHGSARLLKDLGLLSEAPADLLSRLNDELVAFYRGEPVRLALSVGFYFLAWLASVIETYAIMWALGLSASVTAAIVIEAVGAGVGIASFMVPGNLGAMEAGRGAIFAALGLGAPAGLAFSLVVRIREALWAGFGFLGLWGVRASGASEVAAVRAAVCSGKVER
jgi:uncharacterized protein (TIRG00374 family)